MIKKNYIFLLIICIGLLTLVSCKKTYTVTFDSNGGSKISSVDIKKGKTVSKPTNPVKEGYEFICWEYNGEEYNFDTKIEANILLRAKWNKLHVHEYKTTLINPTCLEKGYTTYLCECGDTYNDDYVEALGHEMVVDERVEATCENTGLSEGSHCKNCDYAIAQTVLPAKGHKYETTIVEPTCLEKGYTTYSCECGDTYNDDYVEALGHEMVVDERVEATCENTGLSEGSHCKNCDYTIEQTVLPAKGHKYETTIVEPTCLEKGYTTYLCECGDTYKDNYTNVVSHKYEDGLCIWCNKEEVIYSTIKFNSDGGSVIEDITDVVGKEINLPTPVKNGFNFVGWYLDDKLVEIVKITKEEITLVARWEEIVVIEGTLEGKKVSILGDSISTFYASGSVMNSYYSAENTFYYPRYSATIKTVDKTWWYQLLNNTKMILGINNSWSGSCAGGAGSSAGVNDSRINTLVENGTPDIVIIYLGTNDCASGFSTDEFGNAIETIVNKIKALGVKDVFITTLGYSAYTGMKYSENTRLSYNAKIREIASKENCGIVPLDEYIVNDNYMIYLGDNLHYNAKGAELLSKIYEKSIKEYFDIEFDEEIDVEHKEVLPEGILGKVTATANSDFWGGYATNVFFSETSSIINPQFSTRYEITKNTTNNKYYVTKIIESGETTAFTGDYVIIISDSHEKAKLILENLNNVVVGSIVEFDTNMALPLEITFKDGDGSVPSTPNPDEPGDNPYQPVEGELNIGAYNTGVWTLYESTVIAYSADNIDESSTYVNFYIIKLTKSAGDNTYTITGLKEVDVVTEFSSCDYYILIYRDLDEKSYYENAKIGDTVVINGDITSGRCSIDFK